MCPATAEANYPRRTLPPVSALSVSVVISAYTEDRWDALVEAVRSVADQRHVDAEIIVVVDHNPGLLDRETREIPGARVIANDGARGL